MCHVLLMGKFQFRKLFLVVVIFNIKYYLKERNGMAYVI